MSGILGGGSSSQTTSRLSIPIDNGLAGTGSAPKPVTTATAASAAEEAANRIIEAEQQRSERQRIAAIQQQLGAQTQSRARGYGIRSLFGGLGSGRRSQLGVG
ncbi:MAG: hypothetical protein LC750_00455 [Actinobacteria bacterium]|nr:hypothetical protein [Actinomycetota bacterium]